VLGLADPITANVYAVSHDYFKLFAACPRPARVFTADEGAGRGRARRHRELRVLARPARLRVAISPASTSDMGITYASSA